MIIERTVQEELARIAAMLRDASERLTLLDYSNSPLQGARRTTDEACEDVQPEPYSDQRRTYRFMLYACSPKELEEAMNTNAEEGYRVARCEALKLPASPFKTPGSDMLYAVVYELRN